MIDGEVRDAASHRKNKGRDVFGFFMMAMTFIFVLSMTLFGSLGMFLCFVVWGIDLELTPQLAVALLQELPSAILADPLALALSFGMAVAACLLLLGAANGDLGPKLSPWLVRGETLRRQESDTGSSRHVR